MKSPSTRSLLYFVFVVSILAAVVSLAAIIAWFFMATTNLTVIIAALITGIVGVAIAAYFGTLIKREKAAEKAQAGEDDGEERTLDPTSQASTPGARPERGGEHRAEDRPAE
ncbi:hypothetical protein [Corynebacterium otitidis]|uniref:Putative secreted protein n=1 Tax=Corynebacterium otitidis ATCC 51513 TaxID=883169 RepID=I7JVS2_9CORY|nr:hypothetical protein [Corynebacterium otitidis]EJZ81996.1 hypothetical protein HMPREF9719_01068 [Corynebacterium otitidis ATCC 51513]KKO83305.1 hypothetical protein AAV33_07225 [Corynebacterium otitidis]CCI83231.1 putative secreted protein [Corynebacterium otitidis ATCC 51513]